MEILTFFKKLDPRAALAITAVEGVVSAIQELTGDDEDSIQEAAKFGQDYKERAVVELEDLSKNIFRLENLVHSREFNTLVPEQVDRTRLQAQLFSMELYQSILQERVDNFLLSP